MISVLNFISIFIVILSRCLDKIHFIQISSFILWKKIGSIGYTIWIKGHGRSLIRTFDCLNSEITTFQMSILMFYLFTGASFFTSLTIFSKKNKSEIFHWFSTLNFTFKFVFSKKATKIDEIFTFDLTLTT